MKRIFSIALISIVLTATASSAATILVFGDRGGERAHVTTALQGLGNTVTNQAALPADLSGFDTIWHIGAFTPLSGGVQTQLSGFLADGKGIYLTGERPCCEALNTSIGSLINANLKSGSVQVGGFGDVGGPYTYNANAVGNIDADLATGWLPSAPGSIGGVTGNNVVVSADQTGRAVAAAWEDNDLINGGRIALFMDVNWLNGLDGGELQVIANTQEFLFDGFVGPNPDPDPNPNPVPLPAGLPLLVSAIMSIGLLRRRRNKA